ncbi:YjdF family protein [Lancefieldella rimae]|uniref:YjdF family protein n=1 Tax=Lancefieldella rimae TaxID=1383 RepID=UPI0028E5EDE4|nr:YjdF family protein [Lancefieldella rimae]
MERFSITLTILFDAPFWVDIFERIENSRLTVTKITFGAEPKDYEVHDFVLRHFYDLKFSSAVAAEEQRTSENPKRRQRTACKQMQETGIGTKSQQAIQLQLGVVKTERKCTSKERRKAEKQRQFDLKQQKRKEKHRGH